MRDHDAVVGAIRETAIIESHRFRFVGVWVDGLPAGFRDFGVFASRSINLSAAECSSSPHIGCRAMYNRRPNFFKKFPKEIFAP
jgi:hypothetical protein